MRLVDTSLSPNVIKRITASLVQKNTARTELSELLLESTWRNLTQSSLCRKWARWKAGRFWTIHEPDHIPYLGDAHADSQSCKHHHQFWRNMWPDPTGGSIHRRCISWALQDYCHNLCHLHAGNQKPQHAETLVWTLTPASRKSYTKFSK